jgi:hypothetical protein
VALVESLVDHQGSDGGKSSDELDVPELLWSGNSVHVYQEFRTALEAAGIEFMDQHATRLLYESLQPRMEIWTSKRDHEAARNVWRQITGEGDDQPDEMSDPISPIEAEVQPPDEPSHGNDYFSSTAPDNVFLGEFHSENASAQVYGGDVDVAEDLKACLRENGIPCAIDVLGDTAKVRVLSEHEARAKEIIREVIEATPPE